jgi:ABC-type nitrate/sulfonate/bicarbonate transport system permease component
MSVLIVRAGIVVVLLAAWEVIGRAANPLLYVPPSAVVPALGRLLALDSYPDLPEHLLLTLREIAVAYALAIAAGVGAGAVLGLNRVLGRAYGPILAALYAVPAVVWYPSLMLFFGLDAASKIAFGFLLGFFPIVLAVLTGLRSVDHQLLVVARAFGAGPWTTFARVVLPAITATLVAGLRTGLALTVVGVLVGEVLGARAGLGYLINHAYGFLRTAEYAALALLALVLVLLIDGLGALAESRARRWTT